MSRLRRGAAGGVATALMVLVLGPAAAHAGTAYVSGSGDQRVVHYDAAAGEKLHVLVDDPPSDSVIRFIEMEYSPVVAGAGCTVSLSPGYPTVECPKTSVVRLEISGHGENDAVSGRSAIPTVIDGGPGADRIEGAFADARLSGGEGNDWIDAMHMSGPTEVSGGAGRDSVYYGQVFADVTVTLDGVDDDGVAGDHDNVHPDVEVVYGGYGNDTIIGGDGNEELLGGGGTDRIDGGAGADMVVSGYSCEDVLDGGEGDDTLTVQGRSVADGGPGDDRIRPALGGCGLAGDIRGGSGRDTFDLTDAPVSGPVAVSLDDVANDGTEYEGHDNVHSDVEVLRGGQEDDWFVGANGAQRLEGGYGDDVLDGAAGADELVGGDGEDVADYSRHRDAVTVDLDGQVADDGAPGEGDTVGADIEELWGGDGDDVLTGNGADNLLSGGPGADRLSGLGGDDVADYSERSQGVHVTLDDQANDGARGEGDDVAADIEDLLGGTGDDVLVGGGADNVLDGGPGADVLRGGAGTDAVDYSQRTANLTVDMADNMANDGETGEHDNVADDVEGVFAGTGDDTLTATAADNFLLAGDGADHLTGGGGEDLLAGQDGADVIVSRDDAADQVQCGNGPDAVTADVADQVAADCETVAAPAASTPTTPSTGTKTGDRKPVQQLPVEPLPDRAAPTAKLKFTARAHTPSILKRGLTVKLTCSESCSAIVMIMPSGRTGPTLARRGLRPPGYLARVDLPTADGARRVRLLVKGKTRRLLRTLGAGEFSVVAVVSDRAGNKATVSRGLRLLR